MSSARIEEFRLILIAIFAMMLLGAQPFQQRAAAAQAPEQVATEVTGDIDITSYSIDAQVTPESNAIQATATVTFRAVKASRSATFELNGSLKVTAVRGADAKPLQFLQDSLDTYTVKVDMGQVAAPGQTVTLTFDYSGQLVTAEGGPLPDKRLAYIGPDGMYLHYASRWFPFHEYGTDRATTAIRLTLPKDWKLAAHSDAPVTSAPAPKNPNVLVHTIAETSPVLPGTIAAAPYIIVPVNANGASVEFYARPGSEGAGQKYAEEAVQIVDYYQKTFGPFAFGRKYVIAQIDDDSLETLTGAGITLLSTETIKRGLDRFRQDLAREIALQWWGQAVGLRSFDATWLAQGLAQYSAILYESQNLSSAGLDQMLAEVSERALAYESEASITQAPSQLNDQTPAFRSVIFYKGSYVYHMLRYTISEEKFFNLLRSWYAKNKGKNVSIGDFERETNLIAGQDMRWFFGQWVESTGVPEFTWDYTILRTKAGEWRVRGTLRQSIETFRMPVDILISAPGGEDRMTLEFRGTAADFNANPKGGNPTLIVDPERKILRVSDTIRTSVVVRRGIQEMQEGNYVEAEAKLRDAIKLAPRSSWAWYNLGLLYMKQGNSQKAIDAFTQSLGGDLQPAWLEVWSYIYRGNAYDALGQRDRAVAEYDKAIESGNDYDGAQAAAQRYRGEPYRPQER